MVGIVSVIFLFIGFIWAAWKYYKSRPISKESVKAQQDLTRISLMEDIGNQILENLTPAKVYSMTSLNPSVSVTYHVPTLDPLLVTLQRQVISIVVGKYKLDDPAAINHINAGMASILEHLSAKSTPESIVASYDPTQGNDLILEACRDLIEYPRLDPLKKILVAQYIVNKTQVGEELDYMYNYIAGVALDPRQSALVRAEAADILNLSNSTRYMKIAQQSLEMLRQLDDAPIRPLRKPGGGNQTTHIERGYQVPGIRPMEMAECRNRTDVYIIPPLVGNQAQPLRAVVPAAPRTIAKPERSVYEDGQSVHNTGINESVLEAARELVEKNRPSGSLSIDKEVLNKLPIDRKIKADAAIHRINTDSSTFKHGTTLYGIYQSLLKFISTHPQKADLDNRLSEELVDMHNTCSSGHLSRLLSVIQGFDVKSELKIKVKIDDEIYAKVKHTLDQALQSDERSDELIEDMSSPAKTMLTTFALDTARKSLPDILKEYKDIATENEVLTNVIKSLDKYTITSGRFSDLNKPR